MKTLREIDEEMPGFAREARAKFQREYDVRQDGYAYEQYNTTLDLIREFGDKESIPDSVWDSFYYAAGEGASKYMGLIHTVIEALEKYIAHHERMSGGE
jgi:hypothetical protein